MNFIKTHYFKTTFISSVFALLFTVNIANAEQNKNQNETAIIPIISENIFDKAKSNENWKLAAATGKQAQVVFMNISTKTNPKNEIGMETHSFDQVIFIVDGKGKAELDGKISNVKSGDMIFVPSGTSHNIMNTDSQKPIKLISVYSENDIPANSIMKNKLDSAQ